MLSNSISRLLGEKLRGIRHASGLSQAQMAKSLNLSLDQIRDYESGLIHTLTNELSATSNVVEFPLRNPPNDLDMDNKCDLDKLGNIPHEDTLQLIKAFVAITDVESRNRVISFAEELAQKEDC